MTARVGLVGLGSIGATHAAALAQLSDQADLVVASGGGDDPIESWPQAQRSTPGEILHRTDLDLIVVASPSNQHAEHAMAAMDAGTSCVVEKPIATTASDADALLRAAQSGTARLYPIAQRRLEEQHVAIKDLLDSGELGRLLLAEVVVHWYRDPQYYAASAWRTQMPGGGSLMNQGLHSVDLLSWFLGPLESVTGHVTTLGHGGEAEDTSVLAVRAAGGALGSVITTTATQPGDPALLTLRTTKGAIELSHTEIVRWEVEGVDRPEAHSEVAAGSADPKAIGIAGHVQAWNDVLAAWRNGTEASVTAVDAWRTVTLIDGAYTSARTGARVDLPAQPR